MVCIYCQGKLAVTNSRPQKSRNQIWRRRLCKVCTAVFTSIEAIDLSQALIVTKGSGSTDGARPDNLQPFDRDRLFISLYESLRHRPTAASDARGLADTVTAHIITKSERGMIPARTIIITTVSTLRRFDDAAATHYSAFHPLPA